jgi:TonB-like protein
MMRLGRKALLLVALLVLSGCAPRWDPNAQTVLSANQRLKERTGIDGDPIPLDDERYRDYLDKVRRAINAKWGSACVQDATAGGCEYKPFRVVIVFGILKNGHVPSLEVAERADDAIYDEYAANAIRLAQPFSPPPEAMLNGHEGVPIVAAFQYITRRSRWWPW